MQEVFKHIKSFEKATDFQKTITSLLINLVGDKKEIAILKQAFEDIDTNNDGNISSEDFKKLESDSKWKEILLSEFDLQGAGEITYHDFLVAAIDHQKLMTD